MSFANPKGIGPSAQGWRARAYPGWAFGTGNNANGVAVENVCWTMTQGSACRATLGFGTESRWDSRRVEFESPHLSCNGSKSISTFVFPGALPYFFNASSTNSNNAFVGGTCGR